MIRRSQKSLKHYLKLIFNFENFYPFLRGFGLLIYD